jgi:hypothetical protein
VNTLIGLVFITTSLLITSLKKAENDGEAQALESNPD